MHKLFAISATISSLWALDARVVPCSEVNKLLRQPELKITIQTSQESYLPGEVLDAAFIIRNVSTASVIIPQLTPEDFNLEVLQRDDNYTPPRYHQMGSSDISMAKERRPNCAHPILSLGPGEFAKLSWYGSTTLEPNQKRDSTRVKVDGLQVMRKPGPGRIRVSIYGQRFETDYTIIPVQIESTAFISWPGIEKGREYGGFRVLLSIKSEGSSILAVTNLVYRESLKVRVEKLFVPRTQPDLGERWEFAEFLRIGESDSTFEFESLVKSDRGITLAEDLRIRTGGSELLLNPLIERANAARASFRADPLKVKAIDWKSIL